MISSDLHGAEEPIRWTLGWQMQDRVYDEPMHREEEERPHQDVFGIDLWGTAPGRWTWTMMDRTSPLMLDDFQGTWQLS
jgi:23S rRNA C2498 (ribose-2'-O)-methylase RlmM